MFRKLTVSMVILVVSIMVLSACNGAPFAQPTETPSPTLAPTDTPVPSETPVPTETATPQPTATATLTPIPPLGLLPAGVKVYCVPQGYSLAGLNEVAPAYALPVSYASGNPSSLIPAQGCIFSFYFNQPVPDGLTLKFFEENGATAWTETPLTASVSDPSIAFGVSNHTYIANPPYWQINYRMDVVDTSGAVIASSPVNFYRQYPGLCWDGSTPVPITNFCPITDPMEREPKEGVDMPIPPTHTPEG